MSAEKPDKKNGRKPAPAYMKYSGMAIQMGIIILAGSYLGKTLDAKWQTEPWLTVIFALLSIFVAFYITLKDLL